MKTCSAIFSDKISLVETFAPLLHCAFDDCIGSEDFHKVSMDLGCTVSFQKQILGHDMLIFDTKRASALCSHISRHKATIFYHDVFNSLK